MQLDLGSPTNTIRSLRWLATLIAFSVIGAMVAPIAPVAAQTGTSSDAGVLDLVPATSLLFVEANLDTESDQVKLASELLTRAGLNQALEDQGMSSTEDLPANARVGLVVTSLPDASALDVADVSVDPMSATDSLDQGGYAAILSAAEAQSYYDGLLASMNQDATDGAGEIVESEYGGVTITSLQVSPDEDFVDPQAVAMVGDYIVVAARAEDIQPLVDTFNGDIENISTVDTYTQLMSQLPTERLASGYIDGPAIMSATEQQAAGALDSVPAETRALADAFTAFTFSAEQQGFRLETRSVAGGEAFPTITPLDGTFFDKVPSSSLLTLNGSNIDSHGIVTLLALAFASEMAGQDLTATPVAEMDLAASQAQVFAQAESLLGFNLKTDLIDHLVGEFGVAVTIDDVMAEVPSIDAIVVSDVDNASAVQDVMSKVAFIVGAGLGDQTNVETVDVNGSTINSIDLSGTDTASLEKVEFGVLGEQLVISVGSGLDDYVNGPAEPLSQDPNFQAVMEQMPAEYGSLTYVNMPVLMDIITGISGSMDASTVDADTSCGEYSSQEEAQAAYDADQFENFELDQDFDGEACEDYFAPAASPVATEAPYGNILGMAIATTQEDGVNGSTTYILIGD